MIKKGAECEISAARKAIMPITAGTETFQETGEELRGDDTMVMITNLVQVDYFLFRLIVSYSFILSRYLNL